MTVALAIFIPWGIMAALTVMADANHGQSQDRG